MRQVDIMHTESLPSPRSSASRLGAHRVLAAVRATAMAWGGAALLAVSSPASAEVPGEQDGRSLFLAQRCDICHAVPAAGIRAATRSERLAGPRLAGLADRYTERDLTLHLLRDERYPGRPHNRRFRGSEEEVRTLVAWLLAQPAAPGDGTRVATAPPEADHARSPQSPSPQSPSPLSPPARGMDEGRGVGAGRGIGEGRSGRTIFLAERCQVCHGVATAGIAEETLAESLRGPDLSGYGQRYPADRLALYLKKEDVLANRPHLLRFRGGDEDLHTLIAWLAEQQLTGDEESGEERAGADISGGDPAGTPSAGKGPHRAAREAGPPGGLRTEVRAGFRTVDVGGAVSKYREDVNLDEGFRLFELAVDWQPGPAGRRLADRFHLDLGQLGGDPYSSATLSASKDGLYDLRLARRASEYFYADFLAASGPDLHTFDFERVRESGELRLWLNPRSQLTFAFERQSREGTGTTTTFLTRQVRDFFPVASRIDETTETFAAAYEQRWDRFTLVVEERYRGHESDGFLSLGSPVFGAFGTGARLDAYTLSQPYDSEAWEHAVHLRADPTHRLSLGLTLGYQDLSADLSATESGSGVNPAGGPLPIGAAGSGSIDRTVEIYDFDLTWTASDRVAVVGGAWYRDYDESGTLTFGALNNQGLVRMQTTGAEAGVKVDVSPRLILTGGLRFETRSVNRLRLFALDNPNPRPQVRQENDAYGFFFTAGWHPRENLAVTAEYDDTVTHQPFRTTNPPFTTLLPTDQNRLRLTADWRLGAGFTVATHYQMLRGKNDLSTWKVDQDQAELALGWQGSSLSASLGYGLLEIDHTVSPLLQFATVDANGVVTTAAVVASLADSISTDFYRAQVRWWPGGRSGGGRLKLGGDLLFYENRGDFALERLDLRAFLEVALPGNFSLRLAWRTLDHDETALNLDLDRDDYDADIGEISVGYRW